MHYAGSLKRSVVGSGSLVASPAAGTRRPVLDVSCTFPVWHLDHSRLFRSIYNPALSVLVPVDSARNKQVSSLMQLFLLSADPLASIVVDLWC